MVFAAVQTCSANDTEKMTSVVLVPLFIELGIGKQNDRPVKED